MEQKSTGPQLRTRDLYLGYFFVLFFSLRVCRERNLQYKSGVFFVAVGAFDAFWLPGVVVDELASIGVD